MNGAHPCPAPRCTGFVSYDRLACPRHWFQLPQDLSSAIWEAWRSQAHGRHRVLIARAIHMWIVSAEARARIIAEGFYLDDVEVEAAP